MQRPGNWWQRNWKWAAPTGCFGCSGLILLFVAGVVVLAFSVIKSSDVYEQALATVQAHPATREALGEPIEASWYLTGQINVDGSSGDADLAVPIHGPRDSGTLYLTAEKQAGAWHFEILTVEVDGTSERIDLLTSADLLEAPQ